MRKQYFLPIIVAVLIITQFSCDSINDTELNKELDCTELTAGLLSFDNERVESEFDKITVDLLPISNVDDQIGHLQNCQDLVSKLSDCELISAKLLCYACIETYPPQTEILITLDSSGQIVNRVIDVLTPSDSSLDFVRVHAYFETGLQLQKTDFFGCFENNPMNSSLKNSPILSDTLFYTIEKDTLTLSAILNYNCGGLLKDSVIVESEAVHIFISDTCLNDCEVKCMCDFGFEYRFTEFWQKNIHFYLYLNGFRDTEYKLWKNTKFIDGSD